MPLMAVTNVLFDEWSDQYQGRVLLVCLKDNKL